MQLGEIDALLDQLEAYLAERGLAQAPSSGRGASAPKGLAPALLLRLCHEGRLWGGLSVAMDLAPDELIGPLCQAVGGAAKKLKVLDSRGKEPFVLELSFGGPSERWELFDSRELIDRLNARFEQEPAVKACAVLGEWEDMLQLWCVPKKKLSGLLAESFFVPENRRRLEELA